MAVICANPYDLDAAYFYFSSSEEFDRKYKAHLPVEEYELEFIDGSEFEGFLAKYFFKESNDVEKFFELIEKHERSITAENIVALEYLIEYEHCDVENAFDKLEDVTIFEGAAEDYATKIYEHEIQEKLGTLAYYFDYKDLGKDLVLGGDISEYERNYKKYIITPWKRVFFYFSLGAKMAEKRKINVGKNNGKMGRPAPDWLYELKDGI